MATIQQPSQGSNISTGPTTSDKTKSVRKPAWGSSESRKRKRRKKCRSKNKKECKHRTVKASRAASGRYGDLSRYFD